MRRPDAPNLSWRAQGYLFITDPARSDLLRNDFEQQTRLGVEAEWLEPHQLAERYGHIRTDDLGPAILSPRDGWLDPHAFLHRMLSRARRLGAHVITDRVAGFETDGRRITAAALESGGRAAGDQLVNMDGVWPALVDRVPVADRLKLSSTWSGLYDQNRLDGNMILGRWTGHLDNYYFATGLSGHGLMQAPAVGRALTELVITGSFQTLDLTRMGLPRFYENQPYREAAIR